MYSIESRPGLGEAEVAQWFAATAILAGERADGREVSLVRQVDGRVSIVVDPTWWEVADLIAFARRGMELQRARLAGRLPALDDVELAPLLERLGDDFRRSVADARAMCDRFGGA